MLYSVPMPIHARQLDSGLAVVAISGRLVLGRDLTSLETAVNNLLIKGHKEFVFDTSGLDHADSSGMGTLIACLTHIRKSGGEALLAGARPKLLRLFKMTGVDHMVSLYATVAEATAAMQTIGTRLPPE